MFLAIKRALGVHTADNQDHPYYPTRYFCLTGGCVAGAEPTEGVVQ